MSQPTAITTLYDAAGLDQQPLHDPDAAHLVVDGGQVLGRHLVDGLTAEVDEHVEGVRLQIRLAAGVVVPRPVHLCFGMSEDAGIQRIDLDLHLEEGSSVAFAAHCAFPRARRVEHRMHATVRVDADATYRYRERHVHGPHGGTLVVPRTRMHLGERARVHTDFDLVRGRAGDVEIDYKSTGAAGSVLEMDARVSGSGDDRIKIRETAHLVGEDARSVLTSRVAVRDRARAEIHNELIAEAAGATGHVDCKEIVRDQGEASAIPLVLVRHPRAHVTHEAAVGSVDHKQLETLMARGLDEDQAVQLIIEGLLA
jgi:Fe-S cluster assembly scaffold protein SufB